MTHLDGIAHWLKYEFDVDVLLTPELAVALEKLRESGEHAASAHEFEHGEQAGVAIPIDPLRAA